MAGTSGKLQQLTLLHGGDYLRNRKTGHTYELPSVYVEFTKVLLDDLRQTFPDVNLIGIRVCGTRDIRRVSLDVW